MSDRSFIKVQSQKKEPLSGFFFQQRFRYSAEDIKTISHVPIERKGYLLQQHVFDFLPQDVVLLTSCSGLVCCRSCHPFADPAIYVCNPLNKEWIKVDWNEPENHSSICLAFNPSQDFSDSTTNFCLVRPRQIETDEGELYFSFEIYSSKTKDWKLSKEICKCCDNLYKNGGLFIGGALHWLTDGDQILTFNVENKLSWLIRSPLPAKEFMKRLPVACIGESEGQLHYIMISEEGLQVWFLEDYYDYSWSLKHTKTLVEMEKEHSELLCNLHDKVIENPVDERQWMEPLAFKDGVLVLRVADTVYLYHIETARMKKVCDMSKFGSMSWFCPTVLPYTMSLFTLNQG